MILNLMLKKSRTLPLAVVMLACGIALGAWGHHEWQEQRHGDCDRYALLNPLIRCSPNGTGVYMPEYEEFQLQLQDWIQQQQTAGLISEGAVYFRDLVGGPWFGVDEDATFTPASLFKLPLLIAILRVSQEIPELQQQQIIMSGAYLGLTNVEHPDAETLRPGVPYTVDQLLEKMIVYSDNASADMLKNLLKSLDTRGDALAIVYREMGMYSAATNYVLTVNQYASLFRVLYNGRYLKPDLSQKALELLSRSAYTDALVAGVPHGTLVAHKFGIRDIPGESIKQFHDCGIVYYPTRPYVLCVMTKSADVQQGIAFIREVSRRVYEQVDLRLHAEHGIQE